MRGKAVARSEWTRFGDKTRGVPLAAELPAQDARCLETWPHPALKTQTLLGRWVFKGSGGANAGK